MQFEERWGGVGAVCKTHYIWVLLCLGFNFIFCQQHIEIHINTSYHHFVLLDVVLVKHWVGKNGILLFERSRSNSPEKENLEPWPCTIYSQLSSQLSPITDTKYFSCLTLWYTLLLMESWLEWNFGSSNNRLMPFLSSALCLVIFDILF